MLAGDRDTTRVGFGYPGPDQGYVLRLVRLFEERLHLTAGAQPADVVAGVVAVALKRASLCGRAPVTEDLRVAFDLFGFLTPEPSDPPLAGAPQLRLLTAPASTIGHVSGFARSRVHLPGTPGKASDSGPHAVLRRR